MWFVLCSLDDLPALWVYEGLRARGLRPLELIGSESLSYSLGWEHRLDEWRTSTRLRLADGRVIEAASFHGGVNRLSALSVGPWNQAQGTDREYALLEFRALFLSWLNSVPGTLLNRPTPSGLAGSQLHPLEWRHLAARAGFATHPLRISSSQPHDPSAVLPGAGEGELLTVFVISGRVIGEVDEVAQNACRRLSILAGVGLLGVNLLVSPDETWWFEGAQPDPDLRLGGEPLLDALHAALLVKGEGP